MTTLFSKKLAAVVTGPDTYLDHLGVLAYILEMPLLITETSTYEAAQTFYPQVQANYCPADELDAAFLSAHFDVLFESSKYFATDLAPVLELLYHKKMRFVYCPHGHSDKGHSGKDFARQDISLVYGSHMEELLVQNGAIEQIGSTLATGNYRLLFYQKYRSFYDALAQELVVKKLPRSDKKTVLYTPSWQDGENPTSFFTSTARVIEELSKTFHLIIKLHPFLEKFHPAETAQIVERYKHRHEVLFLERFPCIYPLLQISDLYLGDYSSIGYDFLSFNRPLYFLLQEGSPVFALHAAGLSCPENEPLDRFIERTWEENIQSKEKARKGLYNHVFGKEKSFDQIRREIAFHLTAHPRNF